MGKSSGGGDSTQTTEPWSGQSPYLSDLFGEAQGLYNNQQPQYYPGQTVVPFSPETGVGLDATMNRALGGSPVEGAFNNYLTGSLGQPQVDLSGSHSGANQFMGGIGAGIGGMYGQQQSGGLGGGGQPFMQAGMGGLNTLGRTAEGDFLGSNPFLDSQIDIAQGRLSDQIVPETNATFGLAGRTGSGMHADVLSDRLGQSLGNVETQMRGAAYESERQRQQQAAGSLSDMSAGLYNRGQDRSLAASGTLGDWGMGGIGANNDMYGNISQDMSRAGIQAPAASQIDWNNIDRILGVGGTVEGQGQDILNSDINRWNFGQMAPWQSLGQYSDIVNGMPSGYGMQQTEGAGGGGGSNLSGALGGGMSGYSVGGWPGAIIGGLGGWFS